MNVITLRDYAKQNNVSYEAVRKQVVRYADELGSHIIKDGRQQFLDEEAVAFLDAKRQKNPVAIIQQDKDEQIEALRAEKEALLQKIALQATQLAELNAWKADNAVAIAEANHRQQLIEAGEAKIKALEAQNADLSADNAAKDKTIEEAEKTAQKALQELTEAHVSFETELKKQDKRIEAAEAYAAELEAYLKLPKIVQLFTKRPVLKDLDEPAEKE